jgi:integrase
VKQVTPKTPQGASPVQPRGPELALTKSGVEFDPAAARWAYQDGVNNVALDFAGLKGLSGEMLDSAKSTFKWYAAYRSPDHLENLFTRLQHFTRVIATGSRVLRSISATDLINYRSQLDSANAWYLGTLSGLLKKWHQLGHPGIEADAMLLLSQLRLKGNAKGVAVLTMDPNDGPYTHIEVEALQAALNSAYAVGQVGMAEYVIVWLYMLLGQRNKQYAALKVCDVAVKRDAEGNPGYSVMMPSAKKGLASARQRLVERPLVEQFGEVLADYAQQVRQSFEGVLPDVSQAPLFPSGTGRKGSKGFELHSTADDIGQKLKTTLERLSVQSERTGKQVKVNARRFRRTIGTRAAEEGYGPLVIAGLLDHTDTQNVGVYTANSPAIIERIDRAIAMEMAPLAQAFAGVIAEGPSGNSDPSQRIIDLRIDRSGQAMGECGKHGFCGFAAPVACYTCKSFEAWLDGPHEAVLNYLIARREQLLQTSDKRMASVNDRTILAVAAVVQRCSELQSNPQRSLGG